MEEIQNEMRVNQSAKNAMRDVRAMERMAQRKNYTKHNPALKPQDPTGMPPSGSNLKKLNGLGKGGANEAGLQRVIGAGRKKKCGGYVPGSNAINNAAGGGKGEESDSSDEEMEGGRKYMGKMLAKHLMEMHGGRYMQKFLKGMGGIQIGHAQQSPALMGQAGSALGGQDVPPGGVAAVAYGNPPQAPASFKRNTVGEGMGKGGAHAMAQHCPQPSGAGKLTIMHGEGAAAEGGRRKNPGRVNPRGQLIAKMMREHGISLGEASRMLKQQQGQ
jgi:hypothetical protein